MVHISLFSLGGNHEEPISTARNLAVKRRRKLNESINIAHNLQRLLNKGRNSLCDKMNPNNRGVFGQVVTKTNGYGTNGPEQMGPGKISPRINGIGEQMENNLRNFN